MKLNQLNIAVLLLTFFLCIGLNAQQSIDRSQAFQTDSNKKYSIYVPSSYDASVANAMFLGLHPLNTSRWDAASWRDHLIPFVEANGLLLICPDGGDDGRIDDAIDTAFTSLLLDSMQIWYNVNLDKIFAVGFSWGGRTTYTFGLNNASRFAGFIPIGAAINGTNEIGSIVQHAENKAFFVINGSNDSPNTRFYPAVNALMENNACVYDSLLPGQNHNFDFAGRNELLTFAYQWMDGLDCNSSTGTVEQFSESCDFNVYPNPISKFEKLEIPNEKVQLSLFNYSGQLVLSGQKELDLSNLQGGLYLLEIRGENCLQTKKILIY